MADDDVVDQLDVEDATSLHQLQGRLNILRLRCRVAAGILFQRMSLLKLRLMAGRKISAVRKTELLMVP
jgi:hypothetical protein